MSFPVLCLPFRDYHTDSMTDYSYWQVQNWMLAMSNYPPPPPPDQSQYTPIYPTSAGAQQPYGQGQAEQLSYGGLNAPAYPKVDSPSSNPAGPSPLQNLAHELGQHAALDEQAHHTMQQPHQPLQHPGVINAPGHSNGVSSASSQQGGADAKSNRLRKACDSCSVRKVKCDESGPPCRACAAVDIPCTFQRPSRRRGPPNRHAEAIKRRRLEEGGSPHLSNVSSPSSPTNAAQTLASLSSATSGQQLTAESICPIETLDALIDDFFTYIHPLTPFPHEPSFREAWKRREDLHNKSFLALLSSMIGALVSSFPRKPRQHLKAHKREHLFPNHMSLVHRCQQVCAVARGPGYLESESLSVYDAATSYFLALMGVYTYRWRLGRLYFGECLTIIRTLGLHKPREQAYSRASSTIGSQAPDVDGGNDQPVDNITLEMGRRIFWTMFVSVRSCQQLGASFGELVISPPTPSDPYPPLPVEVDDFCIYPTHNEPQPPGLLSILAGFNANVRAFSSYNALSTMEMAWGIDSVVDWERQKRVLHESLRRCKQSVLDLPPELTIYPETMNINNADGQNGHGSNPYVLAGQVLSPGQRQQIEQNPEQRRRMQYEIQKANIHATSLATRSYIVEKYFNLCEAHDRSRSCGQSQNPSSMPSSPSAGVISAGLEGMLPAAPAPTSHFDLIGSEMRQEKEDIVKDLLIMLGSIRQVSMEPNADSFTMKIRSIAATLLDAPDERKGKLAQQNQEYLAQFLKILMKLERVSPSNPEMEQLDDEETELRHWANLRDYQLQFVQAGGLTGVS